MNAVLDGARLARQQEAADASLLRFITAGSVDDGKSTLIGRLLHDAKGILADQLSALSSARNRRVSEGEIDFSFLTDGLEAEREQGITIDVAYRYFSTVKRKFIIADCPGHEQYTRNMVTGASTADAAVILIDATQCRDGALLTQTRRHTALARLLGIRHLVFAINKMDLLDFDQAVFERIVSSCRALLSGLGGEENAHFVPISALRGDNVVEKSERTPWHGGPALLGLLESLDTVSFEERALRLPVQLVMRWGGHTAEDHRAYAGRVEAGSLKQGDEIGVFPSRQQARVDRIVRGGVDVQTAHAGDSVMIYLDRDLDISRGDVLTAAGECPEPVRQLRARLAWLDNEAFAPGRRYRLRQATRESLVKLQVEDRLNLNSLIYEPATGLNTNDIVTVNLTAAQALLPDRFSEAPHTGSFILIDEASNHTVAAGMVL
ncbi:MAG: GTP-binding protein [Lautropia sp.]|nr:GTP-binding protein [Lautropia sp.]